MTTLLYHRMLFLIPHSPWRILHGYPLCLQVVPWRCIVWWWMCHLRRQQLWWAGGTSHPHPLRYPYFLIVTSLTLLPLPLTKRLKLPSKHTIQSDEIYSRLIEIFGDLYQIFPRSFQIFHDLFRSFEDLCLLLFLPLTSFPFRIY